FAGADEPGDVEREAGVSAFVCADVGAVDEEFSNLKNAVEFEEGASGPRVGAGAKRGRRETLPIPARAHIKLGGAEIGKIEAVRQSYRLPLRVVEICALGAIGIASKEFPLAVEIQPDAAHGTDTVAFGMLLRYRSRLVYPSP